MKNSLNITLIQSNIFREDIDSNISHFEKLISNIKGANINLSPETFNMNFVQNLIT